MAAPFDESPALTIELRARAFIVAITGAHPPVGTDYDHLVETKYACVVCGTRLQGRQRRFCSRACKNRDTNNRHQSYSSQQTRGLQRKLRLVMAAGGCCSECGYDRNLAALTWHHLDPKRKSFQLDLRSLSNRSERDIARELAKCVLLCANCHAEMHAPRLNIAVLRGSVQ